VLSRGNNRMQVAELCQRRFHDVERLPVQQGSNCYTWKRRSLSTRFHDVERLSVQQLPYGGFTPNPIRRTYPRGLDHLGRKYGLPAPSTTVVTGTRTGCNLPPDTPSTGLFQIRRPSRPAR
jgi:hypothetical protein